MKAPSIAELEARLAQVNEESSDLQQRVDAMNALAWELRGSEPARANELASQARELAIEGNYKLGRARAARTMGMTIRTIEALAQMYQMAEEAKRLFDEVDDPAGRAGSRDFLSSLHEYTGDLAGGLELALDALSIARELGDPVRIGYALSSVGGILAGAGEIDAGVERLQEALSLFEKVQDRSGIGTITSRLTRVLKSAGRNDEALQYADKCRELAKDGDFFLKHDAFRVMAEVAQERGEYEQAEQLYRESIAAFDDEIVSQMVGADARVSLARLHTTIGKTELAEQELRKTLALIKGHSISIMTEMAGHEALADAYEKQGKLREALDHLKHARELREQISKRDARNKLTQLEIRDKMEAAKKDAELQKLRFLELHAMQTKLVEAEKMAVLGKLAAGTAHELNTPLGVLRSNAKLTATAAERLAGLAHSLLNQQATEGYEQLLAKAEKLATVLEASRSTTDEALERIAAIATSFKRFTQLDQAEVRTFNVREGLESALALLEPTLPEGIRVERQYDQVPDVEGWPREMNHAFLTVLQNAAQAIEGEGSVRVKTLQAPGEVRIVIEDTGRGMSEEQVAHLFDISWSEDGQRTKMRLGLSAAYSTLQKHGGGIDVSSTRGEGTRVQFRLPVAP